MIIVKAAVGALPILLSIYSVSAATPARIYLPGPVPGVVELSAAKVDSALAHHFGLDHWGAQGDIAWMQSLHGPGIEEVLGARSPAALIVAVESSSPEDFLPPDLHTAYTIARAPSIASVNNLFEAYLSRAADTFASTHTNEVHSTRSSRILDVFSMNPSTSTRDFMNEFESLAAFVESASDVARFGAFASKGLEEIKLEHGASSEVYKTAASAMNAVLSQPILREMRFALLVTPPNTSTHAARATGSAQPPPQQPLPPSLPPSAPIFGKSLCFANATACEDATSSCSGRGECLAAQKAGRTCYQCACNVTTDAKGRREFWVGDSCQRRDISGPFSLLAGTTVVILLVAGAAVGMLYGIGSEELPGTLAGLAAHHAKRD